LDPQLVENMSSHQIAFDSEKAENVQTNPNPADIVFAPTLPIASSEIVTDFNQSQSGSLSRQDPMFMTTYSMSFNNERFQKGIELNREVETKQYNKKKSQFTNYLNATENIKQIFGC